MFRIPYFIASRNGQIEIFGNLYERFDGFRTLPKEGLDSRRKDSENAKKDEK